MPRAVHRPNRIAGRFPHAIIDSPLWHERGAAAMRPRVKIAMRYRSVTWPIAKGSAGKCVPRQRGSPG
jgi:hypothetical protein